MNDLALSVQHIQSLGSGSLGKCFTDCVRMRTEPSFPNASVLRLSAPHSCRSPHPESICLFGSIVMFTILILPTQQHGISFHLFMLSFFH